MRNLTLWAPRATYTVDATPRFSARRWLAWWAWAAVNFTAGLLVDRAVILRGE